MSGHHRINMVTCINEFRWQRKYQIMPTITPHLWFDTEAKEAAEFYTSLLPDSKVTNIITLHDTPSGDCDLVSFVLANQPFMAISAGPLFKFNPSVSFHVKLK